MSLMRKAKEARGRKANHGQLFRKVRIQAMVVVTQKERSEEVDIVVGRAKENLS